MNYEKPPPSAAVKMKGNSSEPVSFIASEINNALTVILGNAQLLQLTDVLTPEVRSKLKAIEQSSCKIHDLVKEFFQGNGRTPR
jgi:hypothetical protein